MFDFTGKTVLITGASYGLGEGFATAFADAGADLVLTARSADLLESVGEGMLERGEVATLLEWLEAMPGEVVDSRARLALLRAWALAHAGRLEVVDSVLRQVEGHLSAADGSTDGDSAVRTERVVDKTVSLRGKVAAVRARVTAISEDARGYRVLSRSPPLAAARELAPTGKRRVGHGPRLQPRGRGVGGR